MDIDAREVRRWREQGLSQQACADKLGLSRDQLRRRAKRDPALHEALRPVPDAPKTKGDRGKAGAAHNRAQAEQRRAIVQGKKQATKPPAYVDPELMAWRLAEYMYIQYQAGKPYTMYGYYRALGISESSIYDYIDGSRDEQTYKVVIDGIPLQGREGHTDWIIDIYRGKPELYSYMYYLCTGTSLPTGTRYSRDMITDMLGRTDICYSEILKNARLPLFEDVETRGAGGKLGDVARMNNILPGWKDKTETVIHTVDLALAHERMKALGYSKKE